MKLNDFIGQLKIQSPKGKYHLKDIADTEQLLRLIQSKAKPFKLWLARVRNERVDETHNPEKIRVVNNV